MDDWPNFERDDVFQSDIIPLIEQELVAIKVFDQKRTQHVAENLPQDYKLNYIFNEHAVSAARLAFFTAIKAGHSENEANNLFAMMLIHDVGKRFMPADIWDRKEKPSKALKKLRRLHSQIGAAYLLGDETVIDKELGGKWQSLTKEFPDFADEMSEERYNQMVTDIRYAVQNSPWKRFKDHPFVQASAALALQHHLSQKNEQFETIPDYIKLAATIEDFDGNTKLRNRPADHSLADVFTEMRDEGHFPALYINHIEEVIREQHNGTLPHPFDILLPDPQTSHLHITTP